MKRFALVALLIVGVDTSFAQDSEDVRALIENYLALFNAEASRRIAEEIYAAPVQFIFTIGHQVAQTTDEVENVFDLLLEDIKGRGWTHSVNHGVDVCMVRDGMAFVQIEYSRIDGNGRPIPPDQRVGLYVVRRFDTGWRIIAGYGFDAAADVTCTSSRE